MFNINEKEKQLKFVKFIDSRYKTKLFLLRVKKTEFLFKRIKKINNLYLLKNTRMSAIELK